MICIWRGRKRAMYMYMYMHGKVQRSTCACHLSYKPSEQANMLISMAYLDQILPVSSTAEAVQVTRRASMWSWLPKRLPTDVASPCVHCLQEASSCVSVPHAYFSCTHMYVFYNYVHPQTYACVTLPTDVGSP